MYAVDAGTAGNWFQVKLKNPSPTTSKQVPMKSNVFSCCMVTRMRSANILMLGLGDEVSTALGMSSGGRTKMPTVKIAAQIPAVTNQALGTLINCAQRAEMAPMVSQPAGARAPNAAMMYDRVRPGGNVRVSIATALGTEASAQARSYSCSLT